MSKVETFFKGGSLFSKIVAWTFFFLIFVLPYLFLLAALFTDYKPELVWGWVFLVTPLWLYLIYAICEERIRKVEKVNFFVRAIYLVLLYAGKLGKSIFEFGFAIFMFAIGIAILGGVIGLIYFGWKQLV